MSKRDFVPDPGKDWSEREEWDREHLERWMDTVRANQKDPDDYGSLGGTPCEGGVFTSASYGSGAEFYSVTGMYENPLLERKQHGPHKGKGPKAYRPSDERINDEVCRRLTEHPLIDASFVT